MSEKELKAEEAEVVDKVESAGEDAAVAGEKAEVAEKTEVVEKVEIVEEKVEVMEETAEDKAVEVAEKAEAIEEKPEKVEKGEEKVEKVDKAEEKAEKEEKKQEKEDAKAEKVKKEPARGADYAKAAMIMSIVAVIGMAGCVGYCIYDYLTGGPVAVSSVTGANGNLIEFTEGSMAEVASRVSPAVVSIGVAITSTNWLGQSSSAMASGTGMIVTEDGYVLTNKHVVSGGTKFSVVMDDGVTYDDVTLVGTDPSNDVAFLKINGVDGLPKVTLGDSKTVTVGQQVLTIGNALGRYQNTVSAGIISGIGRNITATSSDYSSSENLSDMLQTDAAINAGNSGGPLVNAAGEVIGINTATTGSSAEAIGFSIPISTVKGMLKGIIESGEAKRAYVGVRYVNVTPSVAKELNLPATSGAYVYTGSNVSPVVEDSPAAKAGLKAGDLITAVNGVKIHSGSSLSVLIGEYAVGDTVQLTFLRDGNEMTTNVTLGEFKQ